MSRPKIPRKLAEARVGACRVWPEASHVILSLTPVSTPHLRERCQGHIAVDQYWRLYYDPEWLAQQPVGEVIVSLLHETAHCLGRHHERAKRYVAPDDRTGFLRWNYAADMAVWEMVQSSGMTVPENGVTHNKYEFPPALAVEQYFRLLKQREEEEQKQREEEEKQQQEEQSTESHTGDEDDEPDTAPGDGDGGDQDGDDQPGDAGDDTESAGDNDQGDDDADASESGDPADQDGGQPTQGGTQSGDADAPGGTGATGEPSESGSGGSDPAGESEPGVGGGSCADGQARDWELPAPTGDDAESAPGLDKWQQVALVRHCAERAASSGRGTMPGGWSELVETWREPKLDPRRLLQKALARHTQNLVTGSGKFTYRRPSRRANPSGLLRPRTFQPVPRILVIIDTSGSMGSDEMRLGVGLVSKCINGLRLRDGVRVIAGDTYAQWDEQVFDPRKVQLVGRGGTNMGTLIQHAAEKPQHERPELIVVVTDGETPWPAENVRIPVVAALVRHSEWMQAYPPPSWIECVNLY